ncbi:MAG: 6-carboxytetrahydropterin synthase [Deltaproteobacteria bacterium]|nr:6-carboxytetrahydropterin synthase [Deltaproteobacteria bacterium]
MFEVKVAAGFCASHRVREDDGSYEPLHGHNWRVVAAARARRLNGMEMALDFRAFEAMLKAAIDDLDHLHLNDLAPFASKSPTAERVAELVFERIAPKVRALGCDLARVDVWEAETSVASFFQENEQGAQKWIP